LGAVLAADVVSDLDLPPFDRAMMDGYAVRSSDPSPLRVVEERGAGHAGGGTVEVGTCIKIMTGAPVPSGADAVQQVEKTRRDGDRVTLLEPARPGQHIMPRGSEMGAGGIALRAGHRLGPAEIGILAALGRVRVPVRARPRVAVLATGDELVPPEATPGPGRIRNSNSAMLAAQVRALGLACDDLGAVGDDREAIAARIREGLTRDLLLLSGGVSAGDYDLVVPALEAAGITLRLHKAAIKPGRPFCFAPGVFGLPGNPVSAFVIFEVFVRPYLGRCQGIDLSRPRVRARLGTAFPKKIDRLQMVPAALRGGAVDPVPWKGSGDLFALSRANAFIIIPAQTAYAAGADVDVMVLGEAIGNRH
ncbi:MAG TPA: gephyrin-like molybdotransferase Glp, partial [Planctomycetota bacterium]|nr:gephyrin-like molybdotransferase Glp [Planctomycetota bacterium]